MPINLRPIAYGTGLTLSTDGALRIGPIRTKYDYEIVILDIDCGWLILKDINSQFHLTKDGDWFNRKPRGDDEAFFARCRYASLDEARAWLEQVMEGQSK